MVVLCGELRRWESVSGARTSAGDRRRAVPVPPRPRQERLSVTIRGQRVTTGGNRKAAAALPGTPYGPPCAPGAYPRGHLRCTLGSLPWARWGIPAGSYKRGQERVLLLMEALVPTVRRGLLPRRLSKLPAPLRSPLLAGGKQGAHWDTASILCCTVRCCAALCCIVLFAGPFACLHFTVPFFHCHRLQWIALTTYCWYLFIVLSITVACTVGVQRGAERGRGVGRAVLLRPGGAGVPVGGVGHHGAPGGQQGAAAAGVRRKGVRGEPAARKKSSWGA